MQWRVFTFTTCKYNRFDFDLYAYSASKKCLRVDIHKYNN